MSFEIHNSRSSQGVTRRDVVSAIIASQINTYIYMYELSASRPSRFTLGERARRIHWIGDWVGPRAGLDNVVKIKFLTLPALELRPLGRPARSQSLYRLRYPGS
jgi:hypothetical protein